MTREYVLKLNDNHRKVMQAALDLYSRVHMGQYNAIWEALVDTKTLTVGQGHKLRKLLDDVKIQVTGLPNNSYHSISSREIDDSARVAFDLQQVLRHEAWKQKPPEGRNKSTVDAFPSHVTSTEVRPAEVRHPDQAPEVSMVDLLATVLKMGHVIDDNGVTLSCGQTYPNALSELKKRCQDLVDLKMGKPEEVTDGD